MHKVKQGIYRHFKKNKSGEYNYCLVIGVAKHSETNEEFVVYQLLSTEVKEIKVRPINLFLEKVDFKKYPDCEQVYKFMYIDYN